MRTGDAFPSNYLKKEDIGNARIAVTIDRVAFETVGHGTDQKDAPVVYFAGKEKGMVLNKGNAEAIVEAANGDDEMDNWRGVRLVLYVDRNVTFAGKRVGGIRVSPAEANGKQPQAAAQPEQASAGMLATDDDIPF